MALRPAWVGPLGAVILPFLLLVACVDADSSPPGPDSLSVQEWPIINGVPDTDPAHMAVAMLQINHGDEIGRCSGTLISPTVVLTAAHCIYGGFDEVYVGFGPDFNGIDHWVQPIETEIHWGYNNSSHANDLALLRLPGAPEGITPIAHLPASLAITSSEQGSLYLEFVGFGQTETGSTGTKLTVTDRMDRVCEQSYGCSWYYYELAPYSIAYDMDPGGPCSGDSGGPAFITRSGTEYVAGVTSYGYGDCDTVGVSGKVDHYQSWIDDFIGIPNGSSCSSDGQCGSGYCEDGVCCDSPCDGACNRCDLSGLRGTCSPAPDGTTCSDGDPCNGLEMCQSGVCRDGDRPDCDDGNPCTSDRCDEGLGCRYEVRENGAFCSNGNLCDGQETCLNGACIPGDPRDCDDGDPCTRDTCDPAGGCVNDELPDGAPCGEGDLCSSEWTCQQGACVQGSGAADCSDEDICTDEYCDPELGCMYPAKDCSDGKECTQDWCDPADGCWHSPVDDGTNCGNSLCGRGECFDAQCLVSGQVLCDDLDPCTRDRCGEDGCTNEVMPDGTACGDCLACVQGDCVEMRNCGESGCGCAAAGGEAEPWAMLGLFFGLALLGGRRQRGKCDAGATRNGGGR